MATRESMLAARERRMLRFDTRLDWYGDHVLHDINRGLDSRLKLCGQLLRDKVVLNISIPVVKEKSPLTGRIIVTERSQPGEFPRADTTRLMKDIFWEFHHEHGQSFVNVGTTLDYGLYLEMFMRRSFLRRTFLELAERLGFIIGSEDSPAGPLPGQDH